jgi:hypothetical protein
MFYLTNIIYDPLKAEFPHLNRQMVVYLLLLVIAFIMRILHYKAYKDF